MLSIKKEQPSQIQLLIEILFKDKNFKPSILQLKSLFERYSLKEQYIYLLEQIPGLALIDQCENQGLYFEAAYYSYKNQKIKDFQWLKELVISSFEWRYLQELS